MKLTSLRYLSLVWSDQSASWLAELRQPPAARSGRQFVRSFFRSFVPSFVQSFARPNDKLDNEFVQSVARYSSSSHFY